MGLRDVLHGIDRLDFDKNDIPAFAEAAKPSEEKGVWQQFRVQQTLAGGVKAVAIPATSPGSLWIVLGFTATNSSRVDSFQYSIVRDGKEYLSAMSPQSLVAACSTSLLFYEPSPLYLTNKDVMVVNSQGGQNNDVITICMRYVEVPI